MKNFLLPCLVFKIATEKSEYISAFNVPNFNPVRKKFHHHQINCRRSSSPRLTCKYYYCRLLSTLSTHPTGGNTVPPPRHVHQIRNKRSQSNFPLRRVGQRRCKKLAPQKVHQIPNDHGQRIGFIARVCVDNIIFSKPKNLQ